MWNLRHAITGFCGRDSHEKQLPSQSRPLDQTRLVPVTTAFGSCSVFAEPVSPLACAPECVHSPRIAGLSKCGEFVGGFDAAQNPKAVREWGSWLDCALSRLALIRWLLGQINLHPRNWTHGDRHTGPADKKLVKTYDLRGNTKTPTDIPKGLKGTTAKRCVIDFPQGSRNLHAHILKYMYRLAEADIVPSISL
jgi:hypothetical protein